jgi:trigger factor
MMLPDFENAVEGAKAGESKTFDLTFPADYHAKPIWLARPFSSKSPSSRSRRRLPELDAEFAIQAWASPMATSPRCALRSKPT